MVSIWPLISKTSIPFTNPLEIVSSKLITIGITVILMFHNFFSSLSKSRYLSLFLLLVIFALWSTGTGKSTIWKVLFFYFCCWLSLGLLIWLRWGDILVSQNPMEFCVSHSPGWILGCAYTTLLHGQISISCTILSGLLSPPSCV